ncbi:11617_t:CDS:2 [Funneliformis caledonium]|uniref:11617_t:CDS:1 n=1 Tax=Funneliformis caledonium TaxID=1117310 RepID=A0A9N9HWC4_9GLOM|nr:11617_t:CDS:2 [Funneliformis caledonium]
MAFHSHYVVTDESTGLVHNLCYYKECNACDVLNEEPKEASGAPASSLENSSKSIRSHAPLSSQKNGANRPTSKNKMDNDCTDNGQKTLIRTIKPSQKKGPIFKLKLTSDIINEGCRERRRAYKAAMMNQVSLDYSSDEYLEIETSTEPPINVEKDAHGFEENSYIVVGDSDDECMEIDGTEFSKTFNSHTDDSHSNCETCPSSPASNSDSDVVTTNFQQPKADSEPKESTRKPMNSLIDKFYSERYSNINEKASKSQEEFANVPVSVTSSVSDNAVISHENEKVLSRSLGTSEFPIDLEKEDAGSPTFSNHASQVLNELNPMGFKVVNFIQNQDNPMINWFDRNDFNKFMLNSAKRRLEELNNVNSQHPKKYVKPSERSSSATSQRCNLSYVQIPFFKNPRYLTCALTHGIVFSDQRNHGSNVINDDERLELFGDYVLSITISQMAYEKFRGELTPDILEKIHEDLRNDYRLCIFAKMLKLQDLIYARKSFLNIKEMGDMFIKLLAAIVMDRGKKFTVDFIKKLIGPTMENLVLDGNLVRMRINEMINEEIPIKNVIGDHQRLLFDPLSAKLYIVNKFTGTKM